MDFIDGTRCVQVIVGSALRHPVSIIPLIIERPYLRGSVRRRFRVECERVGFIDAISMESGGHMVLVGGSNVDVGDKALPNSGLTSRPHLNAGFFPSVEIAHYINVVRIRRPYGEVGPGRSILRLWMRSQVLVQTDV